MTAPVAKSNDSLLQEIRDAYDHDTAEWAEIRKEGQIDMQCVAGDIWKAMDPQGTRQRQLAARPMIVADELNQYFNQVINGVRANQRAVKFSPVGNGANEEGAEFYADKMREIEYRSKAQIAYTTAFENAVHRGYGYCRVNTRYSTVPGNRHNQDIWIEAMPNPDLCVPDSAALRPDSSDMLRCFVVETWTVKQFVARFGEKAKITSFTAEHLSQAPAWLAEESVNVAEYWKVKTRQRKLLLVQLPDAPRPVEVWADEYKGGKVIHQLEVEDRSVCQYLTNGVEIIEQQDWPGKYIPIASCYGKVIYVDSGVGSKRVILSMTRHAREPYMLYCYYRTTQAELVGMTPKTPYMAYEGQLDAFQLNEIARSLYEPVAVITAKPVTDQTGTQVLPLPMRQPYSPEIERLEIGAEGARRAIQSAMATNFMPTQAQRRNEKSGKALDKIDEVSQRGSYHFNDHYDDMITHVGVIVEDLIDKIYDTDREVGIRKKDDQALVLRINAPTEDEDGKPIQINTKGDYQVTVSTGPAFDSTRQAESEFADALLETPFAPLIADLVMKLKGGGPVMDEIAERLTPPQFKKQKDGPNPQEVMQAMEQMKAENQQLKTLLEQISLTLKTKQLELENAYAIKKLEIESRENIAASKDTTTLAVTAMKIDLEQSIAIMKAQLASIQSTLDQNESELARMHEIGMGERGHQQALEQGERAIEGQLLTGEQGAVNALEQGQQGHRQALEQMAAQPTPEAGA